MYGKIFKHDIAWNWVQEYKLNAAVNEKTSLVYNCYSKEQVSRSKYQESSIKEQVSRIKYQRASIKEQVSRSKYQAASNKHQDTAFSPSMFWHLISVLCYFSTSLHAVDVLNSMMKLDAAMKVLSSASKHKVLQQKSKCTIK
eukprot:12121167-Ditylum_brightwellii.AAC.1